MTIVVILNIHEGGFITIVPTQHLFVALNRLWNSDWLVCRKVPQDMIIICESQKNVRKCSQGAVPVTYIPSYLTQLSILVPVSGIVADRLDSSTFSIFVGIVGM
jgi:hypothetical protein